MSGHPIFRLTAWSIISASSASSPSRCTRVRLIRSSTFAGDSRVIRSAGPGGAADSLARSSRRCLIPLASRRDLLMPSSMWSGCDNPDCSARAVSGQCDNIAGMAWGEVELEPEVSEWLEGLDDQRWAQAVFHLDLLEDHGVLLVEPYTRQLSGKLRELRFYCGGNGSASPIGSRRDVGSSC
jgi:Phage derived protein Gp49-like (DUF891)